MKIYIVRHGQTDKNKERLLQGRSNQPLNETGRQQAKMVGEYFKEQGIEIARIYSSPLIRAVETAELAGECEEAQKIMVDDRLLEMDYGPYEGVSMEKNPPAELVEFFKDFVHNPAPDGMEQLADVTARLGEFLKEIACEEDVTVLISTHAIAMKGALEYLTPDSHGSYWSKYIGNCALYYAEYKEGAFSIPYEVK